jgi:hypothetical protein
MKNAADASLVKTEQVGELIGWKGNPGVRPWLCCVVIENSRGGWRTAWF